MPGTKATAKKDFSPLVVAISLTLGLSALTLGGPLAGLLGAAIGATAGGVVVRAYLEDRVG